MQAIELTPRAESLIVRLERKLATGTSLETIARLVDLRTATLEQLLQRRPLHEQAIAWDDAETALDKLENWLSFEYDSRAEGILARIESCLASGLTRERLVNETGIRMEILEYLLKRQQGSDSINNYGQQHEQNKKSSAYAITQLEIWLADEDIQSGSGHASIAPTPTCQNVQKYLSLAHTGKRLIAITGDVGIGKSAAARAYAADHPKTARAPGVVYVEFTELDTKPIAALHRILKSLPARHTEAPRQEHLLLDYLASCFVPGDLLILDECNHLAGRKGAEGHALGFVRDLFERSRAGLAMLGNADLRARVWGEQQGFPALASRTHHFSLDHTTEADVDIWMRWKGLAGKAMRKTLIRIAARPGQNGGLRALERLVETHRDFFPDKPIESADLERIAGALGRL
jgi:type II secretory pathway predicted ATPase ExeA